MKWLDGSSNSRKMSLLLKTKYHDDSDADDEYERSLASPQLPTDSEISPTDSDSISTEHTPTTYGNIGDDRGSPRTIISEWTAEECAEFVVNLGLRQYRSSFIGLCGLFLLVPLAVSNENSEL